MDKVDGLNRGAPMSPMERWENAINENKKKNEERQGIMDRGQRAAKTDTDNRVENHGCQTCASRRYQDQSNDSSVSFQTPTHVPAMMSTGAVIAHEMEHVASENARAERDKREVVHSSVSIQYATCPECGVRYASGGETRTVTKDADEDEDHAEWQEMLEKKNRGAEGSSGRIVDSKA